MERLSVHGRERNGCVSENFLKPGQSLITLNRLLSSYLGVPLSQKLGRFPSDKKRILYLAQATAERTGLREFPQYLTLLFEIDALIANDDRHLNNIAVIEENGRRIRQRCRLVVIDVLHRNPNICSACLKNTASGNWKTRLSSSM